MGLDMYMYKTKKIDGFTAEDYEKINAVIENQVETEEDLKIIDLEKETGIKGANALLESVNLRGSAFTWYSIFNDVGYWRKANQIHKWFVENVQEGIDNCQLSMVTKDKLEELYEIVNEVKDDSYKAAELLPTASGFFFGSTEYGEWYQEDVKTTLTILETLLNSTDFDNEVIFYQSSW